MPAFSLHWLIIILFWLGMGGYFINHLRTEIPPTSVAFTIPVFGLDVYWYGIIISSGIVFGAWVVAQLAERRGARPRPHLERSRMVRGLGVGGGKTLPCVDPATKHGSIGHYLSNGLFSSAVAVG